MLAFEATPCLLWLSLRQYIRRNPGIGRRTGAQTRHRISTGADGCCSFVCLCQNCCFEVKLAKVPKYLYNNCYTEQGWSQGQDVLRKVNRHLLPLFFCVSLLCNMDRGNLAFAAPQLSADLRFTKATYGLGSGESSSSRPCLPVLCTSLEATPGKHGLGAGVFFLGYAIFQVPATLLCARVGAPRFLGHQPDLLGGCRIALRRGAIRSTVLRAAVCAGPV